MQADDDVTVVVPVQLEEEELFEQPELELVAYEGEYIVVPEEVVKAPVRRQARKSARKPAKKTARRSRPKVKAKKTAIKREKPVKKVAKRRR